MTVYSGTEGVDLCRIERAMYRNIILVSVIAMCVGMMTLFNILSKKLSLYQSTERTPLFLSQRMMTYIPLTLYPRRGRRGISDILLDAHVLPKLSSYE
jgi:hypothetical protein